MATKKRKKLVICVAGMTGCGKSTVARRLAKRYGLRYFSGGRALESLAVELGYKPYGRGWWETEVGLRFLRQRMMNHKFDRLVDEKLIGEARRGNLILDSWTMPWLLKEGFKVWLEASLDVRAKRTAQRDRISYEKAFNAVKEKDEQTKTIYRDLYAFNLEEDFSPFHLVLDTNMLETEEVFQAICMVIDRLLIKKPCNSD